MTNTYCLRNTEKQKKIFKYHMGAEPTQLWLPADYSTD